jgi:hypothetical protein
MRKADFDRETAPNRAKPPAVGVNGQHPDDDYPEAPIPLVRAVPVPPFPVDALPGPIADMVTAVAEATQTDQAMPGTCVLSVLSAATGGHAEIEIRGGWREPLNTYTATVAAPGERKSAVQRELIRPLLAEERRLISEGAAARSEAQTRKDVAAKEAERQRNAAAKAKPDEYDAALADAIGAVALADSISVPPIPRLVVDDITPEELASKLAEQGGRLAVITAEGGPFDIIAGRYSRLPNMDVWLKAHCGDEIRVDRKGRAPEHVARPALTLGLMIQPAVIDAIASNRDFRGRGLLARFLYAWPTPRVGHRRIAAEPVADGIRASYETTVRELLAAMVKWAGDPAVLTLTGGAHRAMIEIETAIEATLAGTGELASLADWGAKFCGAVARIAGILHLAEHGEPGCYTPVTEATVRHAYRIGGYFRACAINTFAGMGMDHATADAVYLLSRLQQTGVGELSERDMLREARRLRTTAELKPAIDRLVEHGYLIPLTRPESESAGGRPPSRRYRLTEGTT